MRIQSILFIVLFSIASVTSVRAQNQPGGDAPRIQELQKHVAELEARDRDLNNQILQVGGVSSATEGIRNAEIRRDADAQQLTSLQTIVEAYTHSVEDMDALHREAQNLPLSQRETFQEHLQSTAKEDTVKLALEAAGNTPAAEAVGPILFAAKVVSIGGRWCVRKIDAARLRDALMNERIHLNDVLTDQAALERLHSDEVVTLRQLHDLDKQHRELQEQLVPEQRRLAALTGQAHLDADLHRDADAKGDAEEEARTHSIHIRRCGDWQPEAPRGVRPSEGRPHNADKKADAPAEKIKPIPEKEDGGACTDITGKWAFQTTSFISAKPMPPVHAEIARKDTADTDPPAYEIFTPDREHAKNGPFMRCRLLDGRLDCQVAAISMTCPTEKQAWDRLELMLTDDGNALTGEYLPGYSTNGNAADKFCTAIPFKWPGKKAYRFVPAKEQ